MLRESSTSTATTFCWGRSVATLSAGCHSRKRISATMPVSSSQMAERAHSAEHAVIAAYVPEEQARRGEDGECQHPERPGRQEDKLALVEKAGRIFEEEFEHEVHVNGTSR